MESKEIEKLEKERAKLERAREKLEEERQRFEDERQAMEDARQELEDARQELEDERESLVEEKEDMKEDEREQARDRVEQHREMLRERAEALVDAQREKLERMAAQMEKAMEGVQEQIENSIAGIDFGKIEEDIRRSIPEMEKGLAQAEKHIEISMDRDMKNVGVLNLKDITPEELDRMGEIRNNGIIIAPEELMGRVSSKITKNMGTVVPYKKGWRIYSGSTELSREMLESLGEPIDFIQTGYMEVSKDVTADLIKDKIRSFHNYGQVSATSDTYGILMARCLENYGQISKNGNGGNDEVPEPPRPPKPPRD